MREAHPGEKSEGAYPSGCLAAGGCCRRRFALFLRQCDNRRMRKPLIVLRATLMAGAVLLGSAAGQQPAAKGQKAPAKPSPTPAATPSPTPTPAAKPSPASPFTDQKDKVSYAIGMSIATSIRRQPVEVNPDVLAEGLKDGLAGKAKMSEEESREVLKQLQSDLQAKAAERAKAAEAEREKSGEANKKEGDAFLAANKTKEGVKTLPSGLQYKIVKEGTGPKPTASDTVTCNYRGTLINGTEFDSSYKRGQPASFAVSGVIKGWTEALQLMPVGSKWDLYIPPDLAYGARGAGGDIGPNATLLFEVELLSIQGKEKPEEKPQEKK